MQVRLPAGAAGGTATSKPCSSCLSISPAEQNTEACDELDVLFDSDSYQAGVVFLPSMLTSWSSTRQQAIRAITIDVG
uniref:Polyketide synthase n=1 Tax=Peronospora matthiolae TaxID=2874970 RepID=A0AAV1VGJ3_9STRA